MFPVLYYRKYLLPLQTFFGFNKHTQVDTLSYKTRSLGKNDIEKKWYVADAEGKTLGRFSSEVARIVRGKHKTGFTPHADCGDHVIVVNAEHILLSGDKMSTKEYQFYSGHPGGQRRVKADDMLARRPEYLIEKAVKGMLPKNRLGRQIFGNLHVYAGSNHPHEAQKPENLDI